jgi:osmotically-inducible protein OsmY
MQRSESQFKKELIRQAVIGGNQHATQSRRSAGQAADEDLRRRVRLFLAGSNRPGLRHVEVTVDGDTVLLSGKLNSFYEKQLANELSRRVAGVIRVDDRTQVNVQVARPSYGRVPSNLRPQYDPLPVP